MRNTSLSLSLSLEARCPHRIFLKMKERMDARGSWVPTNKTNPVDRKSLMSERVNRYLWIP